MLLLLLLEVPCRRRRLRRCSASVSQSHAVIIWSRASNSCCLHARVAWPVCDLMMALKCAGLLLLLTRAPLETAARMSGMAWLRGVYVSDLFV